MQHKNNQASVCCFLPQGRAEDLSVSLCRLLDSDCVNQIWVMGEDPDIPSEMADWVKPSGVNLLGSSEGIRRMAELSNSEYVLIYTKSLPLQPGPWAIERMLQVARDTGAGMVYTDHFQMREGQRNPMPLIDYQQGSLRDDFNFGSLMLYHAATLKQAAAEIHDSYQYAGLYALRLGVSRHKPLFRLPEFLYTEMETDTRASGQKIFDYVDPRNRAVQIEMEQACTHHLKLINAWLPPRFKEVRFDEQDFAVEASVIIPVLNRASTVRDAIESVRSQQAPFRFNLIVVDNHSTDGTSDILRELAETDSRIVHHIPDRYDLGIGGCWNEGVFHPMCGKFAIQLDSDDLYIDDTVLKRIVSAFYDQQCGMVVGSYRMVDFSLNEIPPGLIDHREWTPDNGRNNALRINGLGAPRAFYTPLIRSLRLPNVSYGEDYALALAISRHYQIGRIYEPLYLCRRWHDNTDASLDIGRMNAHNLYKDRIRTIELKARLQLMQQNRKNPG